MVGYTSDSSASCFT